MRSWRQLRQFARVESLALLLGVITALLMAWQEWGMNRVLVVSPQENFGVWAEADAENQGQSQAVYRQDDAFELQCSTNTVIPHPYCNLYIQLTPEGEAGLDLSRYDTLILDMAHHSTGEDTVRVFLSHYYSPGETDQTAFAFKQNQSVVIPYEGRNRYSIPLGDFYVPSWWVYISKLKQSEKRANLTNVKRMLLSTGDSAAERTQTIKMFRAEFHGKWIATETLYRFLLFAWVMLALGYLAIRGYQLNEELARRRKEAQQLQSLNHLLNLKSKRYEELAKQDELCGILNRAGIRPVLQDAVNNFLFRKTPFCVLMIDIDYFKKVNDSFGHERGDQVLKRFAEVLGARCRGTDTLARWGGEEFVVICEKSVESAGAVLAENLCDAVRTAIFPQHLTVTCSIGVAEVDIPDVSELFARADAALYRAKQKGRDRVCLSNSDVGRPDDVVSLNCKRDVA
jgi:diguanylate cyclase (GGDEF)-like protein